MAGGEVSTAKRRSRGLACSSGDRVERKPASAVGQRRSTAESIGKRSAPGRPARARTPAVADLGITPGARTYRCHILWLSGWLSFVFCMQTGAEMVHFVYSITYLFNEIYGS
jgi:hypothetical protein